MKFGKQPAPVADINEGDLEVHKPKTEAAGVKAVMVALERAVEQAGRGDSDCAVVAAVEPAGRV